MDTIKKYLLRLSLMSGVLFALCINANAQRGSHSSGGGGGSHSFSGGGSRQATYRGGVSTFSGNHSVAASRPSSYSNRPANSYSGRPASYNHSYANRPSYASRPGYAGRPYVGVGYGYAGRPYSHGYGFYGGYYHGYHGGYFYGPYGYYPFYPAFGFRLGFLPFGYSSFYWGGYPYYYYNGIYYQPYGEEYQVVEPPLGATVTQLPSGAVATVIDGQEYYEYHGTYYKEQLSSDNQLSYTIVGKNGVLNGTPGTTNDDGQGSAKQDNQQSNQYNTAPQNKAGDKLSVLPDGSKSIVINQQKFFVDPSGTYYQEEVDGDKVVYVVVGQSTGDQ